MEQDAPKIEFPCSYPIKVLGRAGQDFETVINEIFEQHAPAFDRNSNPASPFQSRDVSVFNPRNRGDRPGTT